MTAVKRPLETGDAHITELALKKFPKKHPREIKDLAFVDFAEQWKAGKALEISVPPIEELIADTEDEVEPDEEEVMEATNAALAEIHIIPVSIDIASQAPLDTLAEMQTLYVISKNVMATILKASFTKKKISPFLLGWMKECESLVKSINGMTEGFQKEVQIKKLELARALIESNSQMGDQLKIRMIRELELMEVVKGGAPT
jgi:hypothetical protein